MASATGKGSPGGGVVTCSLRAAGAVVGVAEFDLPGLEARPIAIVTGAALPAAGVVSLECAHEGGPHAISHIRIAAVRTGDLVTINVP